MSPTPHFRREFDEREPPHIRYSGNTNWHNESTLSDGTPTGKMGASWYLLDENGNPYQLTKSGFRINENGFHNIKAIGQNEFIINSGGDLGIWGHLKIVDEQIHVVKSLKGSPPIGAAPTGNKALYRSLNRLGVLPMPEKLVIWGKRCGWTVLPLALIGGMVDATFGGFLFISLIFLFLTLCLGGLTMRILSSDKVWEWDLH